MTNDYGKAGAERPHDPFRASGLSVGAVHGIEHAKASPRTSTLAAMVALEHLREQMRRRRPRLTEDEIRARIVEIVRLQFTIVGVSRSAISRSAAATRGGWSTMSASPTSPV